ncbi:hypothetical protein POTOM_050871 [Populus tomentosa]|uniref:Cytochrome c domain-containing protein n=1 Tax=Populus tomentosa TaxID=118781 RepID=A0A8X8C2M3_POPTO|nr:hypothetical protein POTOM_050871 [Populus tomentosa]
MRMSRWKGNEKQGGSQNPVVLKQKEVKLVKSLALPLMAALVALSPIVNTPVSLGQTLDVQRGASLFSRTCIGCHDAGGNIIQPGATLFTKDLQRNGVDTEEEIYRITYFGKGRMPGFGESCTPRGQCTFGPRLQDEEIKLLAQFVKSQADQGWPNIEITSDKAYAEVINGVRDGNREVIGYYMCKIRPEELLQPGGFLKLIGLGHEDCVSGFDSVRMLRYAIFKDGKSAKLPYPLERTFFQMLHEEAFMLALLILQADIPTYVPGQKLPSVSNGDQMAHCLKHTKAPQQVAPTMNTMAGALFKVFRASPDHAARNETWQACFDYMSLEGVFSNGLIALLSGLDPRTVSSVLHFFAVAIYGGGRLMLPLSLVCTVLSRLCRLGRRGCPVTKLLTIENHQQYFRL